MTESSGPQLHEIERLATTSREPVRLFASLLQAIFGDELLSATVYGAAVLDPQEFAAAKGPVRTVVVVAKFALEKLRRLAGEGKRLLRQGIGAPMVLTPEFIADSCDTFPLELLEMQQQHVTVLGDDPLAALSFEAASVARQCERELKVILLGMHQRLLAVGGYERQLPALSSDSAEHFCRILAGMLWLKGRTGPMSRPQLVSAAEEVFGRKLAGVAAALDAKRYEEWATYRALYDDVAALGQMADRL